MVQTSADAARVAAERRWSDGLLKFCDGKPESYGDAIEAIDEAMASAATDAELSKQGAGLSFLLRKLNIQF